MMILRAMTRRLGLGLVLASLAGCGGSPPQPTDFRPSEVRPSTPSESVEPTPLGPRPSTLPAEPGEPEQPSGPSPTGPVPEAAEGPTRYLFGRTHSPITRAVVASWREVFARSTRDANSFAKIGASTTVSTHNLKCFASRPAAGHEEESIRQRFAATRIWDGGQHTTPFDRSSLAATVGWSTQAALAGTPSPLERELAVSNPRYAFVQFGTNDVNQNDIEAYAGHYARLLDQLLAAGVLPITNSVQPRDDNPTQDAKIPAYNAVVRGLSEYKKVPYYELHETLLELPNHGIGNDGVHLNVYVDASGADACQASEAALRYGYNVKNLYSIQALSRIVMAQEQSPPDTAPVPSDDTIRTLPFVHVDSTATSTQRSIDRYTGCGAPQDESGPERYYRLELSDPAEVTVYAVSINGADVDLHYTGQTRSGEGCLARHNQKLTLSLGRGVHEFVVDTYVSGGTERSGEYVFIVLPEQQ